MCLHVCGVCDKHGDGRRGGAAREGGDILSLALYKRWSGGLIAKVGLVEKDCRVTLERKGVQEWKYKYIYIYIYICIKSL